MLDSPIGKHIESQEPWLCNTRFKSSMKLLGQTAVIKLSLKRSLDLILATFMINLLGLALPLSLMQVYDRIIPNKGLDSLTWLVIGCSIAIFLEALLRFCRDQVSNWIGSIYEHKLDYNIFKKILNSDLKAVQSENTSALMEKISLVSTLQSFYCKQFFETIIEIPFSFLYLYTLAFLNFGLAMWIFGVVLIMFAIVIVLRPFYKRARIYRSKANSEKLDIIMDGISKIHFVKAFAQEDKYVAKIEQDQAKQSKADFWVSILGSIPGNVGMLISQLTLFIILGLGAADVINGRMTIGVLTACMMIGSRLVQPAQSLANYWLRSSELSYAKEKVSEIFKLPDADTEEKVSVDADVRGDIYIENVFYRNTEESKFLLEDLTLKIEEKEMIGISASESEYASKLLQLIAGLSKPERGNIYIDDLGLSCWPEETLRTRVAFLSGEPSLVKGTIIENLTLFDPQKTETALDTAMMVNLDEAVSQLPKGYDTMLDRESKKSIPASLIQLIALTRILTERPSIILLDNADAQFDQKSLQVFSEIIQKLKGKTTIIMVTDNEDLLKKSDRIIYIKSGKISGTSRFSILSAVKESKVKIWKKGVIA